jgi:hypothetical protein
MLLPALVNPFNKRLAKKATVKDSFFLVILFKIIDADLFL